MRHDLVFAFPRQRARAIAAGVLHPASGLRPRPMIAAHAMGSGSVRW